MKRWCSDAIERARSGQLDKVAALKLIEKKKRQNERLVKERENLSKEIKYQKEVLKNAESSGAETSTINFKISELERKLKIKSTQKISSIIDANTLKIMDEPFEITNFYNKLRELEI